MTDSDPDASPDASSEDPASRESSEFDLEHAALLDELAAEFLAARQNDLHLTPEAFAAEHPSAGPELLAVLRGIGALQRVTADNGPLSYGQRVGPYRVRHILGRGGMGVVYEATEVGLDRTVALKAIDAAKAGPKFRLRFLREGRAAAQLEHPNIVPVLGAGEDEGVLWYAMRRIDGDSLDQLVKAVSPGDSPAAAGVGKPGQSGQPQPASRSAPSSKVHVRSGPSSDSASGLRELLSSSGSRMRSSVVQRGSPYERAAARVALQLAEALGYAHSCGVLHRDVKPGNVLIDRAGSALLTDFGLCKVSGDESLTAADDIVGTLRYLAPEALRGQTDQRADVYGAGLILYELVCLKPAFGSGTKHSLIDQILHAEPVPASVARPGINGDLARIIAKSSAKLPEERYQTAALLAADLSAFLEGRPVEARAPSALYLARLCVSRNKALAAIALFAAIAVAASTLFYITQLRSAFESASEARDEAIESRADALVATAEAVLGAGDIHGAAKILEGVPAKHHGWMWRHLSARAGHGRVVAKFESGNPISLTTVQGGKFLLESGWNGAALRRASDLKIVGRLGGPSLGAIPIRGGTECIHLSRMRWDLSRLRWAGQMEPEVKLIRKLGGRPYAIYVSPDESEVLILDAERQLYALSAEDGAELWRRPIQTPFVLAPIGPRRFVAGLADGRVIEGGEDPAADREIRRHQGPVTALLVENAKVLASGSKRGELVLYGALTGGPSMLIELDGEVREIARTAVPGQIAVHLSSSTTAVLDVRSGQVAFVWSGMEAEPVCTVVVGGRTLTVLDNSTIIENCAGDHDGRIGLPAGIGNVSNVAVRGAREGAPAMVVAETNVQSLRIYNLGTGLVRELPIGLGPGSITPAISPNGRYVAAGAFVAELETGADLLVGEDLGFKVYSSVWAPNGDLYMAAPKMGTQSRGVLVWRWRVGGAAPLLVFDSSLDFGARFVRLFMHPDGRMLYAVDGRARLAAWRLVPTGAAAKGETERETEEAPGGALQNAWVTDYPGALLQTAALDAARDAIVLACADGVVRSFSLVDGREFRDRQLKIAPHGSGGRVTTSLAFGPEPGTMMTCNREGSVELWDTDTGDRRGTLAPAGSDLRTIAFDETSGWIVGGGLHGVTVLLGSGQSPVRARGFAGDVGVTRLLLNAEAALSTDEPSQRALQSATGMLRALKLPGRFAEMGDLDRLIERLHARVDQLKARK